MNYKLEAGAGSLFSDVAAKAKDKAVKINMIVEFDFNGIICLVNKTTDLGLLYRDYSNSWTMGWKEVGPNCVPFYSDAVKKELEQKTAANEKKQKEQQAIYEEEERLQKEAFTKQVEGIELDIIPEKLDEYKKYVENNSNDGYSKAVIDYSERWAKLMQKEISAGKSVKEVAEQTQKGLGFFGITGFQYGCVVKGLSHFWKHGEELRKWHNKEYGHEGTGVVNPAVLTLTVKD